MYTLYKIKMRFCNISPLYSSKNTRNARESDPRKAIGQKKVFSLTSYFQFLQSFFNRLVNSLQQYLGKVYCGSLLACIKYSGIDRNTRRIVVSLRKTKKLLLHFILPSVFLSSQIERLLEQTS